MHHHPPSFFLKHEQSSEKDKRIPALVRLRRIKDVLSLGCRSCNKLGDSGVDKNSGDFCTVWALVSSPSGPTFTWRLLSTAEEGTSLEEFVWLGVSSSKGKTPRLYVAPITTELAILIDSTEYPYNIPYRRSSIFILQIQNFPQKRTER